MTSSVRVEERIRDDTIGNPKMVNGIQIVEFETGAGVVYYRKKGWFRERGSRLVRNDKIQKSGQIVERKKIVTKPVPASTPREPYLSNSLNCLINGRNIIALLRLINGRKRHRVE